MALTVFSKISGNINSKTSSSSVAAGCLDYCGIDTMLHITCCQYTKEQSIRHLEQIKALGLKNILALRGDLPRQDENTALYKYRALDLIRWIKEEYNDYFTIACSGYPAGHPEAPSYRADLLYLKAKVDAGADFIISQIIFDCKIFENFLRDCREIGITVPVIPGILPIQSYESIRRIAELSQLIIPDSILVSLKPIKNDDDAVRNFGIRHAVDLCQTLFTNGSTTSIHLFTLNQEVSSREILQQLGLWPRSPVRTLPLRLFGENHPMRCKENVRLIFWSLRPKSHVFRTRWIVLVRRDDFPNSRWGDSSSLVFSDLKDYYLFYLKGQSIQDEQLRMYGERLEILADIQKNPFVGWRKPSGYCYQKAIIGQTNTESVMPTAVTLGVFPGSEIVQPMMVDPPSFRVRKDEAFDACLNCDLVMQINQRCDCGVISLLFRFSHIDSANRLVDLELVMRSILNDITHFYCYYYSWDIMQH
ncbi:unnamed protein product [Acanthocheilonema viteae]|uniref:MTHFR SAM-binding regulatory domain-containing protein n=1 Tax=Acanthocheilonema viteae TaxID=6277 RepID=A0A498S4L9_ACAVI|nr:unnamed protein product [Acanthocheilonema viteae]